MTYKLVDVRYNTMWLLIDDVVIVERTTPDVVYFTDGLGGVTKNVTLDFFLQNAEFIEEDKEAYYKKIRTGDSWWCKHGRVDIEDFNGEDVCFYDDKGRYGEVEVDKFLEEFVPYTGNMKDLVNKNISMVDTGMTVGQLLNDTLVVVILTEGVYKGGYTTTVKYELADFMDDEPPFIEVSFITKQGDAVFFTEDLSQPVYELDGLLVVKAKGF